jgi:hypothetical protein
MPDDDFELGDLDTDGGTVMGMLGGGAFFGICGVLMAINLFSGEAEFVHGPRTGHPLVTILGDNVFLALSTLVCLALGAGGLYFGFSAIRFKLFLNQSKDAAFEEKVAAAKERGRKARRERRNQEEGAVELRCPHCNKVSRIPIAYAGRRGRCPKCKEEVRVPDA